MKLKKGIKEGIIIGGFYIAFSSLLLFSINLEEEEDTIGLRNNNSSVTVFSLIN